VVFLAYFILLSSCFFKIVAAICVMYFRCVETKMDASVSFKIYRNI